MKGRIVFLYSELAGYVLSCIEALAQGDDVAVAHWPVHPEAPFTLPTDAPFALRDRSGMDAAALAAWVEEQEPRALVVSGWMDRDYVAVARKWRHRIPVVLTLDNPWTGSWRQRAAVWTAPWFVRRVYNRIWYAGAPQRPFAERLGLQPAVAGWYCADVEAFDEAFQRRAPERRLLYVGRYLPFKGVDELWEAFVSLTERFPDWELHAVGAGAGWEDRVEHPQIVHHGFLQPDELAPLVATAAAFVMPSHREPWGVVLHEMAAAGLPLIASDAVGAATRFLEPGRNGYSFPAQDSKALATALERIMACSDVDRAALGTESRSLALTWTPDRWAATLRDLIA
jgi:glycosyltransferase involved in cell wall biosynthesis